MPSIETITTKSNCPLEQTIMDKIFPLYLVRTGEGNHNKPREIGMAYYYDEFEYFSIQLWNFPRTRFFLRKNSNSVDTYTIYARELRDESNCKLFESIGHGVYRADFKEYIRLKFFLFPEAEIYLEIDPTDL